MSEVIGDTTDPAGTLRPNLPPEPKIGTDFTPLICPPFEYKMWRHQATSEHITNMGIAEYCLITYRHRPVNLQLRKQEEREEARRYIHKGGLS